VWVGGKENVWEEAGKVVSRGVCVCCVVPPWLLCPIHTPIALFACRPRAARNGPCTQEVTLRLHYAAFVRLNAAAAKDVCLLLPYCWRGYTVYIRALAVLAASHRRAGRQGSAAMAPRKTWWARCSVVLAGGRCARGGEVQCRQGEGWGAEGGSGN